MKINTKTARKGFTLVELLVVMAIIAVLASIAIFFAPSLISSTPDDDIGTVEDDFANALEERECGFVYVDAPDSRSGAPLAGAPLIDNTQELFDFDAYNGKAVFLKTDGSVVTVNINETSEEAEIIVGGTAVNILDGVANPTFREAPSILFPL